MSLKPIWCHPAGFDPSCSLCARVQANPKLHAVHAKIAPRGRRSLPLLPRCEYLGEKVPGEPCGSTLRRCGLDGATVSRVRACAGAVRTCQTCEVRPDRLPAATYPPVGRRHLAFHVLPTAGNGAWRRAVDQLRLRWGLFDGMKVVSIATGGPVREQGGAGRELPLESPAAVRAYLPPGCEVIEVANDPARWELAAWPALWGRLFQIARPDDAVLYCHAKGATRPVGSPAHRWAEILWRLSLDYWAATAEALRRHPISGPVRKIGRFGKKTGTGTERSAWHFTGNFWWANCGELRRRLEADPPPADPWGVEAWPGIAYRAGESAAFLDVPNTENLYAAERVDALEVRLAAWCAAHVPTPAAPPAAPPPVPRPRPGYPTISVVVPTVGRASLTRAVESVREQLRHGDEVVVVRDESGDAGHTARNEAMPRCRGDYLVFLDDDNVYLPGALDAVRAAAREYPGRPLVFRVRRDPFGDVVPGPGVGRPRLGQVDTGCLAVPNDPARLGAWGERTCGDWDFCRTTLALYPPDALVMRPEVIAVWRPAG